MTDRPVILAIEHEPACPPGHLGSWLTEAGAELVVCRPWAGDEVPALASYDGFLVLGGSMGANDDATTPWLAPVKERIRGAVGSGLPTLGVCLGHQLVAVALGGESAPNPAGQQVGLLDVGWTPDAATDDLVAPLATPRRGVHWNADIVTRLPDDGVVLAETPAGEVQVARFGPAAWGVQLHPEVDEPLVRSWAEGDRDDHLRLGIDQGRALREIDAAREELDDAWRPLAVQLVALAGQRR